MSTSAAVTVAQATESPDELFARRDDIANAKRATELWAARAAAGTDFDAAWKLARACYYLGTLGPEAERHAALERGVKAGQLADKIEINRPEGHFWTAANMGELAQTGSMFAGLKYKGDIKSELERVIALAPGWQSGSAESALGQWYLKVPSGFLCCGGDRAKGIELLRRALGYDTTNKQTKYTLAEALADDRNGKDEARTLLQQVIDAPIDPEWAAEDRSFKAKAAALLAQLNRK